MGLLLIMTVHKYDPQESEGSPGRSKDVHVVNKALDVYLAQKI